MSKRILVVDDEADIRQLVSDVLATDGDAYEVHHAIDGEDALHKVGAQKPDMIILDIMMPKMDGIETCRRLKGAPDTRHIPVLFLTVKTSLEARQEGFDTGADLYLTKPFDPEELRRLVRGVFSGEIERGGSTL